MTASSGTIYGRYGQINPYLNKYSEGNNALLDALNAWVGTYNDSDWSRYGSRDTNGIYKSKSKYWNPSAAAKDAFNDFKDKSLTDYKNTFTNKFNNMNSYNDWYNGLKDNSANTVSNFLDNKKTSALEKLLAANQRGLLSDAQYQIGLDNLNSQYDSWNNRLSGYLDSYLDNYASNWDVAKNDLESKYENAYNDYSNNFARDWTGDNNFTYDDDAFDNFMNRYSQDKFNAGFEANALKGEDEGGYGAGDPFDLGNLITNAQIASGIFNTQSNGLLNGIASEQKRKEQQLGLGNEGMF